MKAITKYLMMAAASLLLTTACSNEYDESPAPAKQGKPVQFDMTLAGVNSRTVTGTDASRTTTWVEGDAVGIFAYKRGEISTPTAINAKYVLQGTSWVAEGTAIFAEDGQQYDYYAYYPYKEGVENPAAVSLASLADQTTADGVNYGLSDVMGSQNKTVAADAGTIPLVFKHLFAMVEVKVIGDVDLLTKQPASVVLKGVKLGATLNLLGDAPVATVNADEAGTDVTMYYLAKAADNDKAPFAYRAVVPAQTIAAKTSLVAVNGVNEAGKSYELQFSTAVTYEASKFRVITVKIGAPKASITIPAGDITIDPWGESEAIDGEGSEVVVNLISIPMASLASLTAYNTTNEYNAAIPSTATHWYWQKEKLEDGFTASVEDDATYTKVIKFTHPAAAGSWFKGSVGFHRNAAFEMGFYKLTFQVKANVPKSDLRIFLRSSYTGDGQTNWFFTNAAKKSGNIGILPVPSVADTWVEQVIYFDFGTITSSSGSAPAATDIKSSAGLTAFDNLQVRFVPNTNATITPKPTFTIADVKLIKVDESEVPKP